MTRVIASAWSRDGSVCYLRTEEFCGHDRPMAEYIYAGHAHLSRVYFHQVQPLRPECDCGMCSIAERILDEEYPIPPRYQSDEGFDEGDFA